MQNRHYAIEILLVFVIASFVFLFQLAGNTGIWEPWEASTLLVARQISQASITETAFWIPMLDGDLVFRPYLQLWSLATIFRAWPDPGAFLLRLPSAIAGILLTLMSFAVMRRSVSRRAAWMSFLVLLTFPMFFFASKLIQGGIWPIFAVSLPILVWWRGVFSTSRREMRVMRGALAVSFGLSFLAGGLWALAIVSLVFVIGFAITRHNSQFDAIISPFRTRYFLFPLYVTFVLCGLVFGQYMTHIGEAREGRVGITLEALNEALDNGRVLSLERREKQIIGEMASYKRVPRKFVLADTEARLNTDADELLSHDDVERRLFEKLIAEKGLSMASREPEQLDFSNDLLATVRYFFKFLDNVHEVQNVALARVNGAVLEKSPEKAILHAKQPSPDQEDEFSVLGSSAFDGLDGMTEFVYSDEIVKLPAQAVTAHRTADHDTEYVEIQTGRATGYVDASILEQIDQKNDFEWRNWARILVLSIFPWIALWPLIAVGAFVPSRHFVFEGKPFRGEFVEEERKNTEEANKRSPLQIFLVVWLFVGVVATWIGVNFTGFYEFTGIMAVAMLLGLALASDSVWQNIHHDGLIKTLVWIIAGVILYFSIDTLVEAPFYLIHYMLVDPHMNWPRDYAIFENHFWAYMPIFLFLALWAFSKLGDRPFAWFYLRLSSRFSANSTMTSDRSSMSLVRVKHEICPTSFRPAFLLVCAAIVSASFIYLMYLPKISTELTEADLVNHFMEHAGHGEKLYILNHETEQICATYRDCDPGYVCKNAQCQISTFSSYALSLAQPVSRPELLDKIHPSSAEKAYFIVPKDVLYEVNQAYRESFPTEERRNLTVTEAPSSRLYLLTNDETQTSINPLNRVIMDKLPEDATIFTRKLSPDLSLVGFRVDRFTWEPTGRIDLTMFYHVDSAFQTPLSIRFIADWANNSSISAHALDQLVYASSEWLEGDVIADHVTIPLSGNATHAIFEISMCIVGSDNQCEDRELITSIDF